MVHSKPPKRKRVKPEAFLLALGEHCKRLRKQRGYSIDRLAKESDHLSTSVIQRLETGSGPVNIANLQRYAQGLGLPLKALVDFDAAAPSSVFLVENLSGIALAKAAYRTHLPLYSLQAAAGQFGRADSVEPLGWVQVRERGPLKRGMFVARAVGHSMEPKIHDGDLLVFRADPEGTRQGKIVLAQYRGIADPETGGSFTVKVYSSEKTSSAGEEAVHRKIILSPLNASHEPIVLEPRHAEDVRIVAEYLFTLS